MKKFIRYSAFLLLALAAAQLFSQAGSGSEKIFFYHTDATGTPLAMTDESRNVVWRADYKPFGEEWESTQTIENNRRFVGKEKDSETGFSYFGARHFEARIGRFVSTDLIGPINIREGKINEQILLNPHRLNLYAHSLNNPYRFIDPDGNSPRDILERMSTVGKKYAASLVGELSTYLYTELVKPKGLFYRLKPQGATGHAHRLIARTISKRAKFYTALEKHGGPAVIGSVLSNVEGGINLFKGEFAGAIESFFGVFDLELPGIGRIPVATLLPVLWEISTGEELDYEIVTTFYGEALGNLMGEFYYKNFLKSNKQFGNVYDNNTNNIIGIKANK